MRTIAFLTIFLAILSCDDEVTVNTQLENSKWKVFKTNYEHLDGTSESFTKDDDGGFYITFNKSSDFQQTWYPYSFTSTGIWTYSQTEKKLKLSDSANNPIVEYSIISLTKDNLTLYNDNASQDVNGFVKVTLELRPF